MAGCSATVFRKCLTQLSNFGQPLREEAIGTTTGHAEGETLATSGHCRRPLFKSGHRRETGQKRRGCEEPRQPEDEAEALSPEGVENACLGLQEDR